MSEQKRIKFTVYRDHWLRGLAAWGPLPADGKHIVINLSSLYHPDKQMMCVLGHCVRDIVDPANYGAMTGCPEPEELPDQWKQLLPSNLLQETSLVRAIIKTNDDPQLDDPQRELLIKEQFDKLGMDVEFIDTAPAPELDDVHWASPQDSDLVDVWWYDWKAERQYVCVLATKPHADSVYMLDVDQLEKIPPELHKEVQKKVAALHARC